MYLRNLFLNHFILLPMMLVVIAFPRLLLLLFTHSSIGQMMTLGRGGWSGTTAGRALTVLGGAIAATGVTAPRSSNWSRGGSTGDSIGGEGD